MADTPEETIRMAADAYMAGNADGVAEQLAENVRIHGSEREDYWNGREAALYSLSNELARHSARPNPGDRFPGSLVDFETQPIEVEAVEEMAWSSRKGSLEVDNETYEASWTCVLRRGDDGWRIVHSHFSTHHDHTATAS